MSSRDRQVAIRYIADYGESCGRSPRKLPIRPIQQNAKDKEERDIELIRRLMPNTSEIAAHVRRESPRLWYKVRQNCQTGAPIPKEGFVARRRGAANDRPATNEHQGCHMDSLRAEPELKLDWQPTAELGGLPAGDVETAIHNTVPQGSVQGRSRSNECATTQPVELQGKLTASMHPEKREGAEDEVVDEARWHSPKGRKLLPR
eukprot:3570558-Amphidinium_carterae.1